MNISKYHGSSSYAKPLSALLAFAAVALTLLPGGAQAMPAFNRQTGQNCVACHAGGQFPELTPYGRLFKLTGYTIGQRAVPISAMVVGGMARVANTTNGAAADGLTFDRNGETVLATASLLLGGKVTDNIGAFAQVTYDPYATQDPVTGQYHGHSGADNIDIRYADRFISDKRDLIFGFSANNNPSVSDPWNTAAAWMQYVPSPGVGGAQFSDANSPYPSFASGGNIAGLSAYAFWNKTIYAELGGYSTSKGLTSFMSAGTGSAFTTKLRGINPYWRLAYSREWGAHNLMIGTSGMVARLYDPLADGTIPDTGNVADTSRHTDLAVDAQYQYLLDPHAVTAQFVYTSNRSEYSPNSLSAVPSDTTHTTRAKVSYSYQAKYGGALALFNLTGTSFGSNAATRGATLEAFWMPMQYLRFGAQYTRYSLYGGASTNYDGNGRNASDNNSLYLYTWFAY
ncbi:MAG TPA: cytochrome C [Burkholderiaceae bacterium]